LLWQIQSTAILYYNAKEQKELRYKCINNAALSSECLSLVINRIINNQDGFEIFVWQETSDNQLCLLQVFNHQEKY